MRLAEGYKGPSLKKFYQYAEIHGSPSGLITFLAALLELSRRNFLHIAVDNSLKLISGELERAGEAARKDVFRRN